MTEETQKFDRGVKYREVVPHAMPGCRTCAGRGHFTRRLGKGSMLVLCGCSIKRFLKRSRGKVGETDHGTMAWLEGCAPPLEGTTDASS